MQSFIIVSKNEEYTLRPMSEFAMIIDSWEVVGSSVAKSCPTLATHRVYLPGSSVLGILQARILEWVAISFSRGFSRPNNRTQVSCIVGTFFTNWATKEAGKMS